MRASLTVKLEKRTSSYITYFEKRPKLLRSIFTESLISISPDKLYPPPVLTLSERIFKSVDFPAPDAPIMNIACPGAAYPVTFLIIFLT